MGGALVPVASDSLARHIEALTEAGGSDGEEIMSVAAGCMLMMCRGRENCIYYSSCPFCNGTLEPDAPEGQACPLEIKYLYTFYNGYRNEINPEGTNFSVMSLIKEMCMLEIQIMRAERMISVDGAIVEVVAVGIDKVSGTVITRPEMSAKAHTWRLLLKEKIKLFEQMGLTPKAKALIGSSMSKDPSTFAAELVSAYKDFMRKREANIIDVTPISDGTGNGAGDEGTEGDVVDVCDDGAGAEGAEAALPAEPPTEHERRHEPEWDAENGPEPGTQDMGTVLQTAGRVLDQESDSEELHDDGACRQRHFGGAPPY